MLEVEKKRYAGPFEEIPYEYFIQSAIGLVPKDKGKKARLIFHLSYPKGGIQSMQEFQRKIAVSNIQIFDKAVKICIAAGKACYVGKSDMSCAFRHVPIKKSQWF